jgi:hypothetical protein
MTSRRSVTRRHLRRRQNPALIAGLPPYGKLDQGAAGGATTGAGVVASRAGIPQARDVNRPAGVYSRIEVGGLAGGALRQVVAIASDSTGLGRASGLATPSRRP